MTKRKHSLTDSLLAELDNALRAVAVAPVAARPAPTAGADDSLDSSDRLLGARLMRVNHSGEIAAQALYRGQALVARDPKLRAELLEAAAEENDHLAWCDQRARQLGAGPSRLSPLWYAGSFGIGMIAGLAGDRTSLGFLAETENQVTRHLEGHLDRLPSDDHSSRAILEQMRDDEKRHAENATERGGGPLPEPVRKGMQAASRVMTTLSFRL